jgi:hypothetical protein
VVKRKIKKNNKKRISFRPGSLLSKKKQKSRRPGPNLIRFLKISSIACAVVAVGLILYFAEKYIKATKPVKTGPVVLMDAPQWVGEQLKAKILASAGGRTFRLDEDAAQLVAENLESVAWLDDIKALTTDKSIQVRAEFRKPIALVTSGLSPFYVDAEQVVLDYVPMPHLLIVQIKGLSMLTKVPRFGQVWHQDDLAAAIMLIDRINKMDRTVTPQKPLLHEIAIIDVSNYNGRQDKRQPHIILYTKDNTTIIWGAELGTWQKYLESTDEQKLAKLYGYYKEKGTLSGGVKYINLRDPRDNIPLPIDKY